MEVIVSSLVDMYISTVIFVAIIIGIYSIGFIISLKDWKSDEN
jgi:uncharacterized membrane protein YqhA